MKKILLLLCPILILASCNKYPDGPDISLRSKKARLSNTWIISSAYQNGEDKTATFNAAFSGYILTIEKDNNYSVSYSPFSIGNYNESGTWDFNSDKTQVIFHKSNSSDTNTWTILRLKEKELWAKETDSNGDTYEVHLVPKN